jgi:hypothetical protein
MGGRDKPGHDGTRVIQTQRNMLLPAAEARIVTDGGGELTTRIRAAALLAPLVLPLVAALFATAEALHGSSLDLDTPVEHILTMAGIAGVATYPICLVLGMPTLLVLNRLNRLTCLFVLVSAAVMGALSAIVVLVVFRLSGGSSWLAPQAVGIAAGIGAALSLPVAGAFCLLSGIPWRTPLPRPPPGPKATPLLLQD